MSDVLVFPVGQFGGANGAPDRPDTRFPVRVGDRVVELGVDAFTVWAHAHGLPDRTGAVRWTAATMTEALAAAGVSAAPHLTALRDEGLVAEVDPADAVPFARAHRLSPLLLGLGDTEAGYALGMIARPVIEVAGPLFALWSWTAVETDLWSSCERVARDATEVDEDSALIDPTEVLRGTLEGLHGLLTVGAAYLDAVQPDAAQRS